MRALLNSRNILCRKDNWIGHILRIICLLRVTEGQMKEVKGIGRRIQLLDDLRKRRIYWELKEDAEDPENGNDSFIERT